MNEVHVLKMGAVSHSEIKCCKKDTKLEIEINHSISNKEGLKNALREEWVRISSEYTKMLGK